MKASRHIYAPPVIDARKLAREIPGIDYAEAKWRAGVLMDQLAFRAPNLLPVEYAGLDLYQLAEDYFYDDRVEKKGRLVDGASVPRAAWWFCPPDGRHRRAAFIHDLDYALKLRPKKEADLAFYHNLLADGVGKKRAWLMYQAVHRFGDPSKSIARWSEPLYPEDK